MVHLVRNKFRASSVPVVYRHEESYFPSVESEIKLYNPQRQASFVLSDVDHLTSQSKKHDQQFVHDVNHIISNANSAIHYLPPATKPKRRHHTTTVTNSNFKCGSHDADGDEPLVHVKTPCTNNVLAKHRYEIQERKAFSQPIDVVYTAPIESGERRNSLCDVVCRQAQSTVDRVNHDLRRRGDIDHYHPMPARTHIVRSASVVPYDYSRRTVVSRSPSPSFQTVVVASPNMTQRVFAYRPDSIHRSRDLTGYSSDPVYRSDLIGYHAYDPVYRSDLIGYHSSHPVYRRHELVGHHAPTSVYRSRDLIGFHSTDPISRSRDVIGHHWTTPITNSHVVGYRSAPISHSRHVIGSRHDPVLRTRSVSMDRVGRLPTIHNEYAKMETANFLSTAQAILDKPAVYSRNVASLPSIYSIGGNLPGKTHDVIEEPTMSYTYKSYSKAATPLVDLNLNQSHVTPYQPIAILPATTSHYSYSGSDKVRAPLSEVRRRVRGVLCKVKKDPHYFG